MPVLWLLWRVSAGLYAPSENDFSPPMDFAMICETVDFPPPMDFVIAPKYTCLYGGSPALR